MPTNAPGRLNKLARLLAAICLVTADGRAFAAENHASQAIDGSKLRVKEGFKAELLYSVPQDKEGSWVNLCTDPKGRLIVSDQYGGLFRITPPAPDRPASDTQVAPIPVDLGEAQGLLWAFDSLYVVVNKGRKYASGLYRVRDSNGDDQLDDVKLLRAIDGGGEHGPHAVVLHPDGKTLVVVCGNHTKPLPFEDSRVPRVWQEDHVITRMWDAGGHAVGVMAPGGWIARTDAEGKSWELLSIGYRNQFDAAYNRDGELLTYDADMEWDINTPWYRPTRVNHATSGSEFGWRSGAGKWPTYYPDSLPAVVDIGPGSPTGISFGYGSKFPARYQDALYICDWSYGKMYAVHLSPSGSTYGGTTEEFITGAPLPLTDVVVNPRDGLLYFTIGGRRTQSGIYRVSYTGGASTAPSTGSKEGRAAREQRRDLEKLHSPQGNDAVSKAWKGLSSSDRFIRFAARTALEHQDPKLWQDKALKARDARTAINALLGLVRVGDRSLQTRVLAALNSIRWDKLSVQEQLDLTRVYGLALLRMGPLSPESKSSITARLDALYPASDKDLNAELSKLLIHLQAPSAAAKTMALLEKAPTQEQQMDLAYSLRDLKTGWTPALQESYFKWFLKAASFRGGHSFAGFVRNIRTDAVKNLTDAEKEKLKPILEAKAEKRSPMEVLAAGLLGGRTQTTEWKITDFDNGLQSGLRGRDYEKGRTLFSAAACAACHRFNNEGGSYGPDLTGVLGRFSARDLLESILDPSKEVSDQYAPVVIQKKDGDQVTGRVVNMAGDGIMISPNLFNPDEIVNVKRGEIASIAPSKVSQMPEGLINALTKEEVMDLLAYLLSRGDSNSPMFKRR